MDRRASLEWEYAQMKIDILFAQSAACTRFAMLMGSSMSQDGIYPLCSGHTALPSTRRGLSFIRLCRYAQSALTKACFRPFSVPLISKLNEVPRLRDSPWYIRRARPAVLAKCQSILPLGSFVNSVLFEYCFGVPMGSTPLLCHHANRYLPETIPDNQMKFLQSQILVPDERHQFLPVAIVGWSRSRGFAEMCSRASFAYWMPNMPTCDHFPCLCVCQETLVLL